MHESEIKLLNLKVLLLSEIDREKGQIEYHITSAAKETREILQSLRNNDYTANLDKENYEKIVNTLLSIERKAIYQHFKDRPYIMDSYKKIEYNQELLKKL